MKTLTEMLAAATPEAPLYIAVDPSTGCALREATAAELTEYQDQPAHPLFRKPVRVGAVLVDEFTGYGVWFGGAGF